MSSSSKKEKSSKHHKHRNDHERSEKTRDRRSPSDDDRSLSPVNKKSKTSNETAVSHSGTEQTSLSIEETNKLRASLGLKPLDIPSAASSNDDKATKSLNSDENFVHQPAINITEKKRSETVKQRLAVQREKRLLQEKFLATPSLASDNVESASDWIEKMNRVEEEKRKAAQRAKLLEQMDDELGSTDLNEQHRAKQKSKKYSSNELSGLRIEHAIDDFKEGQQVILTLKDKNILGSSKKDDHDDENDEDEDVLINLNMADNDKAKERIELTKKSRAGYQAYSMDESADQFGMFNPNKLLEQYDEKKKSSFRLESGGTYDMSDEKMIDEMKNEIRTRMQTLDMPAQKVASDFYTAAEMEQFKKPKKVTKKKLRSRKMLKADDLLAMDDSESKPSSNNTVVALRATEVRRPTAISSASKERPVVSVDKIKRELITTTASDDEDLEPTDDLVNFVDEDEALNELQSFVNRTVQLNSKKEGVNSNPILNEVIEQREQLIKVEIKSEPMDTGIIVPPVVPPVVPTAPDDKSLVLDTMSEFCRNVGETALDIASTLPALRAAKNIKRTNVYSSKNANRNAKASLDSDDELLEHALGNNDFDEDAMDETPAENVNTKPFRLEETLLSDEPTNTRGIAGMLKLAEQKGYIVKDKVRKHARPPRDISAKNFMVEVKDYDIDAKSARRDRYTSGPLTEFKEKEGYRPEVKLEYVDETGKRMNEKEAFRVLSHSFHGKGSGKKKTEKRMKKALEEERMKKMSSIDTPLQTCNLLKQKQLQLKQPYIVLSGSRPKEPPV